MRKILFGILCFLMIFTPVYAQELPDDADKIEPVDYKALYLEEHEKYLQLKKAYESQILERDLIISNNPIVYFEYLETIDNDVFIYYNPYKLDLLDASSRLHNPAYGEDSEALGQFVDNYDSEGNMSVIHQVSRNSTYNAIQLDGSPGYQAFIEDFTTYAESDPDNVYSIDSSIKVSWTQNERQDEGGIYKDYGAGNLEDFSYFFVLNVTDVEAGDVSDQGCGIISVFSQAIGSFADIWASDAQFVSVLQEDSVDDKFRLRIQQYDGGASKYSVWVGSSNEVFDIGAYYCTYNRSGTNVGFYVYSDAARTTLIEDAETSSAVDTHYRYIQPVAGWESGTDPNDHYSGDIHYLWNRTESGGYNLTGFFTTTDYLEDPIANGSILVQMTNASIPADTAITVEFSVDNSTWVNNQGAAGYNTITDGFLSIDLRELNYSTSYYLRYNFSTTDHNVTPWLYQSRLITTEGNSTGIPGAGDTLLNGTWVYYNLTAIANITGIHDDGNLASTYFIDGDTYNCSEVVGAPGYEVKFNATGIDTEAISLWVVCYVWYDGSASHEVNVEVWNHTSGAYVELGEIPDMLAFDWENFTVYGLRVPLDFVNSTGALVGRLYHSDAGNVNHDIMFDRINILAFVPTGLAVGTGGAGNGAIGFIILGLISIPVMIFLGVRKR